MIDSEPFVALPATQESCLKSLQELIVGDCKLLKLKTFLGKLTETDI